MKAFVYKRYGLPDVLELKELPEPVPAPGQVLIRVRATAVNDYDWAMVTGKPQVYRLMFGMPGPKRPIPGMELAGTIEKVGSAHLQFKAGDDVLGDISSFGFGTYAEYVCVDAAAVVPKPAELSFAEAAALPHASLLAYQALIGIAALQKGERVLINGAGGGVGTLALQMAKHYGAFVAGVDTGPKLARMRELGFDQVIDYKQVDFTRSGERYNLILDCKTTRSPLAHARALLKNGRYVTVGGTVPRLLQTLILGPAIAWITGKQFRILALRPNEGLDRILEMVRAKTLKAVIDGPHPFLEAKVQLRRFGEGQHSGKIVLTVSTAG